LRARSSPREFKAWAAFRRGRLLYGVIDARKGVVEHYYRACYAQEVKCGCHDPRDVLADHGIEVCRVRVVRDAAG
jgi:hypothetical protein